jgi:hypothetical protein
VKANSGGQTVDKVNLWREGLRMTAQQVDSRFGRLLSHFFPTLGVWCSRGFVRLSMFR